MSSMTGMNMEGMSMGKTTTATAAALSASGSRTGVTLASTAGAQALPTVHAGAGIVGLFGVVAYGLI